MFLDPQVLVTMVIFQYHQTSEFLVLHPGFIVLFDGSLVIQNHSILSFRNRCPKELFLKQESKVQI